MRKFFVKVYRVLRWVVQSKEQREATRLNFLRAKRYTHFQTPLLGKSITVVDAASYVSMKNEIFVNEIYKFKTENDSPRILDCGANIGMGVIYFKTKYPRARITAFEPDKSLCSVLRENLARYGIADVQIEEKALWEAEGKISFNSEGADSGRIHALSERREVLQVETVLLSSYLHEQIDFLKIDIEGAEYQVLKECEGSLKNVKNIFVEYHSFDDQVQVLPEILTILRQQGFRLYVTSPGVSQRQPFLVVKSYLGMDMQLNICGVRAH